MNLFRAILIFLGTISLCIGTIGLFVPGLPTTPFVLLTAGLYMRSSDKLYHSLIINKFIGSYILEFQSNRGMSKRLKLCSICTMWIMITVSCVFLITPLSAILIVLALGLIGTIVMGLIIPTINISNSNNN